MAKNIIRVWDFIFHECDGTSTLAQGRLSPRAGSISPTPNQQSAYMWGLGFNTVRGGIDSGDHRFVPGLLEL